MIMPIHVAIGFIARSFNPVTGSPVVSNNR